MSRDEIRKMESMVVQACHYIDAVTGGISTPIQPSTTFARDREYQPIGDYSYSRSENPTYAVLEQVCAQLDGGAQARCFASGMAAITAVFETVNSGEHIVAPRIMYHGAQDWLRRISEKRAIGLSLFDASDPEDLQRAVQPGKTTLVWIETPVNPTWEIIHGADIVFHSATKYYNGHSDVVAGILVTRELDQRWQEIKLVRQLAGAVLGPFEAWLLLRGMRTLFLRFERASTSALKIAQHFENHSGLEKVLYPGLQSHPGHQIAKRQMINGFGGMLSFMLKGDASKGRQLASRTNLFLPATSLGGVESLIEHRATVEGPHSVVPENLVRLSVGIENCDDLIADLEQALNQL